LRASVCSLLPCGPGGKASPKPTENQVVAFTRLRQDAPVEARGGMATGDRGVARRAKTGGFGGVPLGFATDAPRGSAGSFTVLINSSLGTVSS